MCLVLSFAVDCCCMKNGLASTQIRNRRLLSKTLANKVKEIKKNEMRSLKHLEVPCRQTNRINISSVPNSQFVVSLFAKGSNHAPWVYIKDRVFNHSTSNLQNDRNEDLMSIAYYHRIISQTVYGTQLSGYPQIMSELVALQPDTQCIPSHSLSLGFQLRTINNSMYDIYRIQRSRSRVPKVKKIQLMLSDNCNSRLINTVEFNRSKWIEKVILLSTNLRENEVASIDALLGDLINKHAEVGLSEINITSDGSLLVVPVSVSDSSSSNNRLPIGGGGVVVRLIFEKRRETSRISCTQTAPTLEQVQLSKRTQRRSSPHQLRKRKLKVLFDMQKKFQRERVASINSTLNSVSGNNGNQTNRIEVYLYFSLFPYCHDALLTSFDAEIGAGMLALHIASKAVQISQALSCKNTISKNTSSIICMLQSDSKSLIQLFRFKKIMLTANSIHRSFPELFAKKISSVSKILPLIKGSWRPGHPEKRKAFLSEWTASDWDLWKADLLAKHSFQKLIPEGIESFENNDPSKVNLVEEAKSITKINQFVNIANILHVENF